MRYEYEIIFFKFKVKKIYEISNECFTIENQMRYKNCYMFQYPM